MSRIARLALPVLALTLLGCPSEEGGGSGGGPSGGESGGEQSGGESDAAGEGQTVAAIKERGELIVATDAGYVPFEVVEQDGSITGFDIDLVHAVAEHLGVKPKVRNVAWNGIVGELRTGKCDVIFGGMSITEEREKAVLFSEPYFEIGQVVVKRKGDERFSSWKDLNDAAVTLAVQESTTGEMAARRLLPEAELLRFPKADAACLAVVQEKADAVIFDHPYLMKYVEEKAPDKLEGIWTPFTREKIAAAVRQDSQDLKAAIDATLAELEASGRLAELKAKYFGAAAELDLGDGGDAPDPGADDGGGGGGGGGEAPASQPASGE